MIIKDVMFRCLTCKYDVPKHDIQISEPLSLDTNSLNEAFSHIMKYPHHEVTIFYEEHEMGELK